MPSYTPEQLNRPPGIYPGIDFDEYRRWSGWNPSRVKIGLESMARLHWELETGYVKTADQLDLGIMAHFCALQPELLPEICVVWDGGRRAGKRWDEFEAANVGKLLPNRDQWRQILAIRDSIHKHAGAKAILKAATHIEPSMVWISNGMRCKGRPDLLTPNLIPDLKTTSSHKWYERDFFEFGYHVQVGAYYEGVSCTVADALPSVHIVVCTKPPYEVIIRPITEEVLEYGLNEWRRLLREIQECERTGIWPGYAKGAELPIELPAWAQERVELTLDGEAV